MKWEKTDGQWAALPVAADVPAFRCKSSLRSTALRAFRFNPVPVSKLHSSAIL
jgi:hypothetical protein